MQKQLNDILKCTCDQESSAFSSDDTSHIFIHVLILCLIILGAIIGVVDIIVAVCFLNSPDLSKIKTEIEQAKKRLRVFHNTTAKEISLVALAQLCKGPNVTYNDDNKENNDNHNNTNNNVSHNDINVFSDHKNNNSGDRRTHT